MLNFTSYVINEANKKPEPVPTIITNLVKKFNYDDLMTYTKGLMVKYLDIYLVKKLLPMLDKPEEYNDMMLVFNKLKDLLNPAEKQRFADMQKIFKKKFDHDHDPNEIEKQKKEAEHNGEQV